MRRWVLAFDAGCGSCRDVIGRVREHAGDRLELANLASHEIQEMRRRALGDNAPWAPTLLAVDGEVVRAWTGPALSARMVRVLGPSRALRVARAISETRAITSPQRRKALQAIPGVAAGAFLLSGGIGSAAVAKAVGRGAKITALQAVQRVYRLAPTDIKVTPNRSDAPAVLQASRASAALTTLLDKVRADGYSVGAPQALKAELPIYHKKANPVLDLTRYELSEAGQPTGYAVRMSGPKGELFLAETRRSDGSVKAVFSRSFSQSAQLETAVFSNGRVVSSTVPAEPIMVPEGITCQDLCNILCNGGLLGSLGECVDACVGIPWCVALCGVLVLGGCFFGCNFDCCECCNDC